MVREKLRIRFRKAGDLRLTSHHDLMRCFERMLRRAALPCHYTEGFNPKPRVVFALPLPLGITGSHEVVELELDAELPPEEVRERLASQAPAGLEIESVRGIDTKAAAHVRRVTYRVAVPPDKCEGLAERVAGLLEATECWVQRVRPHRRRFDLRRYLDSVRLAPGALEIDLLVTPNGTARPDEVLHLLGLSGLLEAGAVVDRTWLELEDECPFAMLEPAFAGSQVP
jgi:radical SAM-linked protein